MPDANRPSVSRPDIVNQMLTLTDQTRYLEIGVRDGQSFFQIDADLKVAVDPIFRFDVADHASDRQQFHQITSDAFFEALAPDTQFDVIFVDGLHVFEQALRDVLNAIDVLAPGGIIVIDDVKPNSPTAAMRDFDLFRKVRGKIGLRDPSWMGDVYKVIAFIDLFLTGWSYATVEECHGVSVMWRARRPLPGRPLNMDLERLSRLPFEATVMGPRIDYRMASLPDIVSQIEASA